MFLPPVGKPNFVKTIESFARSKTGDNFRFFSLRLKYMLKADGRRIRTLDALCEAARKAIFEWPRIGALRYLDSDAEG